MGLGAWGVGHASRVKGPLVPMAYWLPVLTRLRKDCCGTYGFSGSPHRCLRAPQGSGGHLKPSALPHFVNPVRTGFRAHCVRKNALRTQQSITRSPTPSYRRGANSTANEVAAHRTSAGSRPEADPAGPQTRRPWAAGAPHRTPRRRLQTRCRGRHRTAGSG